VAIRETVGALVALGCLAGCNPVVAGYPKTPVPVLLSRVNRVGAKDPAPTTEAGTEQVVRATAEIYVATSSTRAGNVTITRTVSRYSGPEDLTIEALQMVPNGADASKADIQLEGVWTGNFAMAWSLNQEWATPLGRKVYQR
jgi:hypothetical protein